MKITPNKNKIVSVRVNEDDYAKLVYFAKTSGVKTPSALVRMLFNSAIVSIDTQINKGVITFEDIKAVRNN